MPLKLTRRAGSPFWWLTGTIKGQRIRESAGTGDPRLAAERRAVREAELYRHAVHGEPARVVSFEAAALAYLEDQPRSPSTCKRLTALLQYWGAGRPCRSIDQPEIDAAAKALLRPGHKPATKLREITTPVRAVLTFAARRGWCPAPIFEAPGRGRSRTEWLRPAEVVALEQHAPPHIQPLIVFLVGTGARMGEALGLEWTDVDLQHARARFRDTKNGGDRTVDLPARVVAGLAAMEHRKGRVFRTAAGYPYRTSRETDGGGQVREPWSRAARDAGLPGRFVYVTRSDRRSKAKRFQPLHTPHSARHTWASWHYAEHRDPLRLRQDGGWQSLSMVERYAHLVPASMVPEIVSWRSIGTIQAHAVEKVA